MNGVGIRRLLRGMLFLLGMFLLAGCPPEELRVVEDFFTPRDMHPYDFEAEPKLEAPDRLLFLGLEVGESAKRRAVLRNVGRVRLDLLDFEIEGPFEFSFPETAGVHPGRLLPGEILVVEASYLALDEDPRRGVLKVFTNDPGNEVHRIELLANVELPCVTILPSTRLRFGSVLLGDSVERSIRVINCSDTLAATVELADFEADGAFEFVSSELAAASSMELAPGSSELVELRFIPEEEREYRGALTFRSEDLENPEVIVELEGRGTMQPCGQGSITGRACTPDQGALAAANISVSGQDCNGNEFWLNSVSDSEGYFSVSGVPAGVQEVTVSLGVFSGSETVTVPAGGSIDLGSSGVCVDGQDVPIAVIGGLYDDVGGLLDGLQIDYGRKGSDALSLSAGGLSAARDFLSDLDQVMDYQLIFIECGSLWDDFESGMLGGIFGGSGDLGRIKSNLRYFVESGGSLYVSDQAYKFVAEIFPEAANFGPGSPLQGTGSQGVSAEVVSPEMYNLLGSTRASLYFNYSGWAVMSEAPLSTVTHFRGNARTSRGMVYDVPFLVSYTHSGNQGRVIYTSFHNNAQAGMGEDMERVLRYLIFQL